MSLATHSIGKQTNQQPVKTREQQDSDQLHQFFNCLPDDGIDSIRRLGMALLRNLSDDVLRQRKDYEREREENLVLYETFCDLMQYKQQVQ